MRIGMIISTPFPPEEGIGYHVYNLSKNLIKYGHEVTIITRGDFSGLKKTKFNGINIYKPIYVPLYPFHIYIHGFFVNKLFKSIEDQFDIIQIHTPLCPTIKTSLPIVATIHGSVIGNVKVIKITDLKSFGMKIITNLVSFPIISKLIKRSKAITTVSNPVKEELKKYYSLEEVIIVENAVDEKKFFSSDEEDEFYCLYVGRLSYGKGLFDLLEIAKIIKEKYDIKFYLVGKGELEKKLKEKIIKENLEEDVKILGQLDQDQLVQIYQKAVLFIFLSYYEGFPTVVLEAMSSGLPVLLSDIDAHKYFIDNWENGILIKKGSIFDATKKIEILLDNENLRKKLGKNARNTIESKYTWEIITKRYLEVYNNVLDR